MKFFCGTQKDDLGEFALARCSYNKWGLEFLSFKRKRNQ